MKKVFLLPIALSLFVTIRIISINETTVQSSRINTMMHNMAARFAAFKQYISPKKETIIKQHIPAEPSINFQISYDPATKILMLTKPIQQNFSDVIAYRFSPHKKYFIIYKYTSSGISTRATGEFIGKKTSGRTIMLLIDPMTGKTIASFDPGNILTDSFDPHENFLLIAGARKPWGTLLGLSKPSTAHTSPIINYREASDTGNILQYEIFDLTSQSKNTVIKTLENIQAIQFNDSSELIVKYDDNEIEKIAFQPKVSLLRTLMNNIIPGYFTTLETKTSAIPLNKEKEYQLIGATYNEKHKIFDLTTLSNKKNSFKSINWYRISPQKKIILINSPITGMIEGMKRFTETSDNTNTILIDTETGDQLDSLHNLITYEFNADETRLITFYTATGIISNDPSPKYRLIDTRSNLSSTERIIKEYDDATFAYFEKQENSPKEKLIVYNRNQQKIEYDPVTGIKFEEIKKREEEKNTQLAEEKLEREQKEAKEKIEKEKEEKFNLLTPEKQKQLRKEELPQSEIKKRKEYLSPTTAVITRGIPSVLQIGSELAGQAQEYGSEIRSTITTKLSNLAQGWLTYFMPPKTEQTVDESFEKVKNDIEKIKKHEEQKTAATVEDIEEVISPAIQTETERTLQQPVVSLVQNTTILDQLISKLDPSQWPDWNKKQLEVLEPIKPQLEKAINDIIQTTWKNHGTTIVNFATQISLAAMINSLVALSSQKNLATLNTNELLLAGLQCISAQLITTTGKLLLNPPQAKTALSLTSPHNLNNALILPTIQSENYQLKLPISFVGSIKQWIVEKATTTAGTILKQNDEIAQKIKNIDVQQLTTITGMSTNNALIATVTPYIQQAITNEKLSLALKEIGWILFQSAALGGLYWSLGLGHINTSASEALSYSVLVSATQGSLAALATLTNATTPGAVLTITPPLPHEQLAIAGAANSETIPPSQQEVTQAMYQEATKVIIDENEKSGGLFQTLKQGSAALGSVISSRISNWWGGMSEALATLQEIEPIPL
ncbi:MAG TPA: hypothetical protein VLB80_05360 [Candidatus Babeliales bacterium]|nr:hypothetical protein [Candidatus Babeliales bacterium]